MKCSITAKPCRCPNTLINLTASLKNNNITQSNKIMSDCAELLYEGAGKEVDWLDKKELEG